MKHFRLSSNDSPLAGLTACAAVVALSLAGCGANTTVKAQWQEPRAVSAPFSHLLVVAVSPNSRLRRSFEEAMVDQITGGHAGASAAIQVGSATEPLSRESVASMVKTSAADAVLVTRLLSRRVALAESPARVGVKTQQPVNLDGGPGLVELFSLDYHEYEEPGELTTRSTAVLESSLYDTRNGGRLVYTVTTTSKFKEGSDDVVAEVTTAIARQLRRDGLIH